MNTEVTVSREGEYEISPPNIMEEINIFKGRIVILKLLMEKIGCCYSNELAMTQ